MKRRAAKSDDVLPVLTLADVDWLHAICEAPTGVIPCRKCHKPLVMTPIQMAPGEEAGTRALCAECYDTR